MGASKEGAMSVRERINLVLKESSSEDDPPDSDCDANFVPTTKSTTVNNIAPATTTTPLSFITPITSLKTDLVASSSRITKNSCSNSVQVTIIEDHRVKIQEDQESRVQLVREGHPSNSFNRPSSGPPKFVPNPTAQYVQLSERQCSILLSQVRFIRELNERLKLSEAKNEALTKQCKQYEEKYEAKCADHDSLLEKYVVSEEQRSQYEARSQGQQETIKGQHDTVKSLRNTIMEQQETIRYKDKVTQELERQLAIATAPKSVADKATCTSPPPTPLPPPPQVAPTSSNSILEEESPPRKRMKVDFDFSSSSLAPPSRMVVVSDRHHRSANLSSVINDLHQKQRRSDSPPQLSPVVTPKSRNNISSFPSSRQYFGGKVESIEVEDEFQDELERINNHNRSESSHADTSFRSHHHHYHKKEGVSQFKQFSQSSTSSSFSAFTPPTSRFHSSRRPESRKRFGNSIRNRYSHPIPSSSVPFSTHAPKSSSSFNRNNLNHTATSSSSREPPQLLSLRNNNFLNLSRPVARKPSTSASLPSYTPEETRHFRSLDSSVTPSADTPYVNDDLGSNRMITEEMAVVPEASSSTPLIKKRGVGRPPGSVSRLKPRLPPSASSSSSSGGGERASTSRLSNGMAPEETSPPQRFSQRGRLLKPNRARYSPDPDVTSSREKIMTTRKNYFVTEPFTPDTFGVDYTSGDGTTYMGMEDIEGSIDRPKTFTEDGEIISVVEVPKWRISILEGFAEGEEQPPLDDDMSEEAFHKRHQKLEAKEKQRKRWDSQRLREESYLERLKRKQEERERQKELRRQRKRKGRCDASEEESVMPGIEDIKAIYVSDDLPVGAFGHSLPIVEKVEFSLLWIPPETRPATLSPPLIELDKANVNEGISEANKCESDVRVESPRSPRRSSSSHLSPSSVSGKCFSPMTPPPPEIRPTNVFGVDEMSDISGDDDVLEKDYELPKIIPLDNKASLADSTLPSTSPVPHSPFTVHLVDLEETVPISDNVVTASGDDDEVRVSSSETFIPPSSSPTPIASRRKSLKSPPPNPVMRVETVNIVRCPVSLSSFLTNSSSTEGLSSKASITFFIPNNPLAPRPSNSPSKKKTTSSSFTPSTSTPDKSSDSKVCKDRNIRS